jgi:uncharacterized membrane protein
VIIDPKVYCIKQLTAEWGVRRISAIVWILLILVVAFSLAFSLTNGLHDASSVVATIISCGAATPRQAIGLASLFGLLGAVFGGNRVADTISSVIDMPTDTSLLTVLLAAILGATLWNLITWKLGLPSSSTHALVGGMIGSVVVAAGAGHVLWGWTELVSGNHQITGIGENCRITAHFTSDWLCFRIYSRQGSQAVFAKREVLHQQVAAEDPVGDFSGPCL